jgi:3-dehydroquinate synthase
MRDAALSERLEIKSHRGPYTVEFDTELLVALGRFAQGRTHVLVDANVARLYASHLDLVLRHPNTIQLEATEENKSLDRTIPVFERLVRNNVRRGDTLVAIGGGIVQDITCFIASTLLRGLPWQFIPTTLLAQADSCIGSKSSINLGSAKNIIGTFNPPTNVVICTAFLDSLDEREIHSGVGEILKVHAIAGRECFDRLASEFDRLFDDRTVLERYIRDALLIKQRYIEADEFDRGIRNVFNYGHSFGHAIEAATAFGVPHGIAVSMGMDMANFVAARLGLLPEEHYHRMHGVLRRNYAGFASVKIGVEDVLAALMKDKKNTATTLGLILPIGNDAVIERTQLPPDEALKESCALFLASMAS